MRLQKTYEINIKESAKMKRKATVAPTSALFWVVGLVSLLWYLLVSGAFIFEMVASPEALTQAYGADGAEGVIARPNWANILYEIALFGGVLGCLLLLMRRRIAQWLLNGSLFALLGLQAYWWGRVDFAQPLQAIDVIAPILFAAIGLFLVWFSRVGTTKYFSFRS